MMVEVRTANQLEDLKELLTSGGDVSIAVAYVSESGLELIEPDLEVMLSKGQGIRFILHLDGQVTSPAAADKLLDLSRQYRRKFVAKFFFIPGAIFHPKLYISKSREQITLLSGSYNLTRSALQAGNHSSNVEHGLWVRCGINEGIGQQVLQTFDDLWNNEKAIALDQNVVSRYAKAYKAYADTRNTEWQSTEWQSFLKYLSDNFPQQARNSLPREEGKMRSSDSAPKNYWLFKCSLDRYNFGDLLMKENRTDYWGDGIENKTVQKIILNNIRSNDRVLFYHSGDKQRAVVGTARVVREAYLDPKDHYWQVVDIQANEQFSHAVALNELEANPITKGTNWKTPRSVISVTPEEWEEIVKMGTGK